MKNAIIVGGGILGASAAYHLAKKGTEVTLVDRKDSGQATDAAAGIICPWLTQRRNKAWYALAKGGAAYYESLIRQLEEDGETETGYEQVGAVSIHTDAGKLEKMEERALLRKVDAPEIGGISRRSASETQQMFPPLSPEFASVHVSGAARVNGRALRDALLNAAQKHGAKLIHGSAELELTAGNANRIRVNESHYEAESLILTAGAWASELLKPIGVDLKITPQKAQIIHLLLENTETNTWPVVMPPNNQYILAFEGGRVIVGATHEDDQQFDTRVTARGVHEILDKALAVAPGLQDGTFIEARVGFRPVAPNFLPVIGAVPGFENLFLANGLGASGLTVGPFLGEQLAKLVLDEPLDINLKLYDVVGAIG